MRKILSILLMLSLCGAHAAAQQRFYNLSAGDVRLDGSLPRFACSVPLGAGYADSVYTASIEYPEFIDMGDADIAACKAMGAEALPAMPAVSSTVVVERKQGRLEVAFTPLVFREGRYRKLVSFMLDVKSAPVGKPARSKAPGGRAGETERYAAHSVLAGGKWAKIRVPASGVYRLAPELAKRAGFTDLGKVRVYGYGGALQNETLSGGELAELDDLREVPTCNIGGKRYFYAQGPVSWSGKSAVKRTRNPYSDYGYYFITQQDGEPLSVDSAEFVASFYPSNDDYHVLYEVDDFSWYEGGRNLYDATPIGAGASRSYVLGRRGFKTPPRYTVSVTAGGDCSGVVSVNGREAGTFSMSGFGDYDHGKEAVVRYSVADAAGDADTITIATRSGGPARLDYISAVFAEPRELPAAWASEAGVPEYVYNITNQDLHADSGYKMVIIIPASQKLAKQAERLKAFHESHDGMKVRVVPADELFNEFSSGTPDANAYRRYMKMLYDRAETEEQMPEYLLLFGDCAWDNRMATSAWRKSSPDDFLLCYESENSFSATHCYVNDGFFCCLDDGEGQDPLTKDKYDIAVGRFPVRTAEEARIMVDKTIGYAANRNGGAWENTVMFMGDDGNDNVHMKGADTAARIVERLNPAMHVKRVMWDAYERVSSSTGNSYPDVAALIKKQQASGALVMDYCGHGASAYISHEKVLNLSDVGGFANANLPLWVTASCDISPFDGSTDNIGERLLLNDKGGAVAFFGTARTVYVDKNEAINMAFIKNLFTKRDGKFISIGQAQSRAKNDLISGGEYRDETDNKLHYALLGDPALVLNIPTLEIVVDSINGKPVSAEPARLKAGSVARISGHVERGGAVDGAYNGVVNITVRDSEEEIRCRLNNTSKDGAKTPFVYRDRTRTLFSGSDKVEAGRFAFSFAVPMDINYSGEAGMMNLYAINDEKTEMANGYTDSFVVGGTEDDMENDRIGPSIFCYLNSPTFVNGGKVNSTPYFVAELKDKDGINFTGSGIGHDLQLVIDDDISKVYNLNDNFRFDFGSYTSGRTYYNIPELEPGVHRLKFRAWDIQNNPSTAELVFNVVKGLEPTLFSVGVTENPVRESTTFIINHDRSGSDIDVGIEIFDTSGRLLWKHEETGVSTSSAYTVYWDLNVDGNHKLRTGIYLYRVSISSNSSRRVSKTKKLIVLNNN